MTKKNAFVLAALAFDVAVLDGVFKYLAHRYLVSDTVANLAWPIDLALHKNPGIIANIAIPLSIVIPITIIVCAALLATIHKQWKQNHPYALACWVIFCGASGNLLDRILHHYTTDYIMLFQRSAVNLADGLVVLGAVMLLWYSKDNSPNGAT